MAEAMTYTSLVEDIKSYCERTDSEFSSQVPRFVMLAENKLAVMVRGLGYLRNVQGTLISGNPVVAKPNRWRETSSFTIITPTQRLTVRPRAYEFCRMYNGNPSDTGVPLYYSDYGYEHFLLAKTPDDDYAFELNYFERPEPLDSSHQTSWTTQYAPQLLLYACLIEAFTWLRRNDYAAQYQALFNDAATSIGGESTRRQVDHTIIRSPE